MKKHIKQLVERLFNDIYDEDEFSTDNLTNQIGDDMLHYNYHPKTRYELKVLLKDKLSKDPDANLNDIDTSQITDMHWLFYGLDPHNIKINLWDVSNVKNMNYMFYKCENFNADLSNWDMENVLYTDNMFYDCISFEGNGLEHWRMNANVEKKYMFSGCFNLKIHKMRYIKK